MTKRTIVVDWDSREDLKKQVNLLRSRIGGLPGPPSRRERQRQLLNAYEEILATDISPIYGDLGLNAERKFYVYAHLDTSRKIAIEKNANTTFAATLGMDYFPFYVGKGAGDRCFDILRNETHRKMVQKLNILDKQVKVIKIREGLTESEALQLESKLIDIFGLIVYRGMLCNLDEGHRAGQRRQKYVSAFSTIRAINSYLYKDSSGDGRKKPVVPQSIDRDTGVRIPPSPPKIKTGKTLAFDRDLCAVGAGRDVVLATVTERTKS